MSRFVNPALLPALLFAAAGALVSTAATPADADAAEAERLLQRASDFVTGIPEGSYSYAYQQFYWLRAQSYVDRVREVYPDTPAGRALRAGERKVGPFDPDYFKARVMPRLVQKKQYASDELNCAIFLYEFPGDWPEETRLDAFERIIGYYCQQKRWAEALNFRVREENLPLLRATVLRFAARQGNDGIAQELLDKATPAERASLLPSIGEGMALRGVPRAEITRFLDDNPSAEVRLGVLRGMAEREMRIRRAALLRQPLESVQFHAIALQNPEVRDNIESVAATFFPQGIPESRRILEVYRSSQGERPAIGAATEVHAAYLDFLGASDRVDEIETYLAGPLYATNGRLAEQLSLKAIEVLARAGRLEQAAARRASLRSMRPALADSAEAAFFRGRMHATEARLVVREDAFAALPIVNPNVLASLILEWKMTPDHLYRGAPPFDAVVFKRWGGFENLPLPASSEVQEAAGTYRPY